LVFRGLVNYGYNDIAKELAQKTIDMFANDIKECGEMHEYYDPESAKPVINPGFQNWNLLSINMAAWLDGGKVITEF
jgi:putative isomerase